MKNRIEKDRLRPVRIWLLIGVMMIIIQILLGGITRLTGSGLSITEWDVITGSLPPLNEHQWIKAFEKYKNTPQFQYVNFDFDLGDFKFIYFWEWLHRNWARFIGVVFAIPFIIFFLQKRFTKDMIRPMVILFLLGALQGAVGWIMVASGLTGDAIYVKPVKLALHFIFALVLLCYTYWFYLKLRYRETPVINQSSLRKLTKYILVVLVFQLIYGALMAGYKAASFAPTWPDINGEFIPSHMFNGEAGFSNIFENKITIHFIHRGLAYLLFILTIIWTWKAFKLPKGSLSGLLKLLPISLLVIQLILGITAVFTSVKIIPNHWGLFEWLAQFHQLIAMFFLLSVITVLHCLKPASVNT